MQQNALLSGWLSLLSGICLLAVSLLGHPAGVMTEDKAAPDLQPASLGSPAQGPLVEITDPVRESVSPSLPFLGSCGIFSLLQFSFRIRQVGRAGCWETGGIGSGGVTLPIATFP